MSGKKFREAEAGRNLNWNLVERLKGFSIYCLKKHKNTKI